jgi:hypothetical protein
MAVDKPKENHAPGVVSGDFVPLTIAEFQRAYSTAVHMLAGRLPPDPTFPTGAVSEVPGLPPKTLDDTPLNRAAYASGGTFSHPAKQASFFWRSRVVLAAAEDKKYRKYVDWEDGRINAALLSAICRVRGSMRTTKKALRTALAAEFERQLAASSEGMVSLLVPVDAPVVRH